MDPRFLEPVRIRGSRIPSAVHLVHRTEDHPEIVLLHVAEELLVLRIERSRSDLLGGKAVGRQRYMIDLIGSKLFIESAHHLLDVFAPRIEDERDDRKIEMVFLLYALDVVDGIVP